MQVPQATTFLTRAGNAAGTAWQTAQSYARSATTSASSFAGRTVCAARCGAQSLWAYAKSAATAASKFFASLGTSATTFARSQPYVAAGLAIATTAAVVYVAMRHFKK